MWQPNSTHLIRNPTHNLDIALTKTEPTTSPFMGWHSNQLSHMGQGKNFLASTQNKLISMREFDQLDYQGTQSYLYVTKSSFSSSVEIFCVIPMYVNQLLQTALNSSAVWGHAGRKGTFVLKKPYLSLWQWTVDSSKVEGPISQPANN